MSEETPADQWIINRMGAYEATSKPIKHGFYATYSNQGCRCSRCKEAHAAWHRLYRQSDSGRERTVRANRKSRQIQQRAAELLRNHYPDLYEAIVKDVNDSLGF